MTLTALENQVAVLANRINQLEQCGLEKCELVHELRVLLSMATAFQAQNRRAIALIKEGKTDSALQELGDVRDPNEVRR